MSIAAKQRLFSSIFPVSTYTSTATPTATPQIGTGDFSSFSQAPSVVHDGSSSQQYDDSPAADIVRLERAWHIVTDFLTLPSTSLADRPSLPPTTEETSSPRTRKSRNVVRTKWIKPWTADVSGAASYLFSSGLRGIGGEYDVFEWYLRQMGKHFLDFEKGRLIELLDEGTEDVFLKALSCVQNVQEYYTYPLQEYLFPLDLHPSITQRSEILDRYQAYVSICLLQTPLAELLRDFLRHHSSIILGLDGDANEAEEDEDTMEEADDHSLLTASHEQMMACLRGLQKVGLGSDKAQRIFAEVMYGLLTQYVDTTYAGQWSSPSDISARLKDWIEDTFARHAIDVLRILNDRLLLAAAPRIDQFSQVPYSDVLVWKQRAIQSLGTLRIREMFNIIVEWESDTKGALEDLKPYLKSQAARSHLISSFSADISQRLLQPGASTMQILQFYIGIVRAFALLDRKGVLLDRVARPIRRYLRERDDTIRIIIGGLLANPNSEGDNQDALIELAQELNHMTEMAGADEDEGELDWDDMNWMPDPVDASADYRKSKGSDVIGTLISLFGTQDIFVKEFQLILGSRLLKKELEFEGETRVLELLKLRFGDASLQACEVMLHDVHESRRADVAIRKGGKTLSAPQSTQFHSRILSRLFWPPLHTEEFILPPPITVLQEQYSKGFESLKATRKLTWMPNLGHVTVELELEDRTVLEECQPWQASVIYAFQDGPSASPSHAATLSIEQLMEKLTMSESLVSNALTFWVSKLVLHQTSATTFTVLENLPPITTSTSTDPSAPDQHTSNVGSTTATSAATNQLVEAANAAAAVDAASAAGAGTAGVLSSEEVASEQMDTFWQYVVHMLKNGGTLKLGRIHMMLNAVVPGMFPYSSEELKSFLASKVREGKIEMSPGGYKLVK
ncbi:hypothetical protein MMC25_007634 [Agyrium rufum]|nr:hypothetical protein [Agyrium rufum]